MSTATFWLSEIGFVFFLVGLAIRAPGPRPLVWLVFVIAWTLSLAPWLRRRLRGNTSAFLVIALALAGSPLSIRWTSSFEDWWPLLPAVLLFLAGLSGVLDEYQKGTSWSTIRRELTMTGFLLVFFGATIVISTVVLTKYYSEMKVPLGDPGFLYTCVVLGCTWFGLDAGLRRIPSSQRFGTVAWIWLQRHSVLVGITGLVILLRATMLC
jgi:hypothetical protein